MINSGGTHLVDGPDGRIVQVYQIIYQVIK